MNSNISEIFSALQKKSFSNWICINKKNIIYDQESKSYVLFMQGINSKLESNIKSLKSVTDTHLVIQIYLLSTTNFSIEFTINDKSNLKKRIMFSSNCKELVVNSMHVRVPFNSFPKNKWFNAEFDIESILGYFNDSENNFKSIENITLQTYGYLKKICLLKKSLKELINQSNSIPKSLMMPNGIDVDNVIVKLGNQKNEEIKLTSNEKIESLNIDKNLKTCNTTRLKSVPKKTNFLVSDTTNKESKLSSKDSLVNDFNIENSKKNNNYSNNKNIFKINYDNKQEFKDKLSCENNKYTSNKTLNKPNNNHTNVEKIKKFKNQDKKLAMLGINLNKNNLENIKNLSNKLIDKSNLEKKIKNLDQNYQNNITNKNKNDNSFSEKIFENKYKKMREYSKKHISLTKVKNNNKIQSHKELRSISNTKYKLNKYVDNNIDKHENIDIIQNKLSYSKIKTNKYLKPSVYNVNNNIKIKNVEERSSNLISNGKCDKSEANSDLINSTNNKFLNTLDYKKLENSIIHGNSEIVEDIQEINDTTRLNNIMNNKSLISNNAKDNDIKRQDIIKANKSIISTNQSKYSPTKLNNIVNENISYLIAPINNSRISTINKELEDNLKIKNYGNNFNDSFTPPIQD